MPDTWDFSQTRRQQTDPLAQIPILTSLLVALSVIITGAGQLGGGSPGSVLDRIGSFGYTGPAEIWDGHMWGLVTPIFIHVGFWHLLFNMLWMVQIGRILERTLPPLTYAGLIAAAAAVGSACEMLVSGTTGVGMSGVVYALFGLMWAGRGMYPAWGAIATRENFRLLVLWGLFCVATTYLPFLSFLGLKVANGAHGGGFLFGLCVGYLFFSPRRRLAWAAPLTLLLIGCVLACTWQPWSGNWNFWKGNREFDRKQYASAIRWYERSLRRGEDPHDVWTNISYSWNNLAVAAAARKDAAAAAQAETESADAAQKAGASE